MGIPGDSGELLLMTQPTKPLFDTGMELVDHNGAPLTADTRPKKKPARKWSKDWVPHETVLNNGKCNLLKWVDDDGSKSMKSKEAYGGLEHDSDYEVVYVCTFENCGKVFAEAPALRKHAHVHGEKQYICHYEGCGKRFMDSSKLKRHFLIHTGEKHFMCPICSKAFSLDFNLRSHMRTHTGENYHTCPYEDCGKRYAFEYKLRGHLKTHHDKMLPDGKMMSMEPEPKATSTANTIGRPFACPYEGCEKRYLHEYKLNLHLRKEHAKEEAMEGEGDEYSEGSDPDHILYSSSSKASGKGKLRHKASATAAAAAAAGGVTATSSNQKKKKLLGSTATMIPVTVTAGVLPAGVAVNSQRMQIQQQQLAAATTTTVAATGRNGRKKKRRSSSCSLRRRGDDSEETEEDDVMEIEGFDEDEEETEDDVD